MINIKNKKILFISLSNIGDAIMTTPLMEFIHQENQNVLFDIVCDKKSIDVFEHCPYIDKIFLRNKNSGFFGTLELINKLRKTNYFLAVDLRTDFLLFFIKANKKFFKKKNDHIHSVEKHFASFNKNFNLIPQTKIWLPPALDKNLHQIIKSQSGKYLALALGANSKHKIWPTINYLNLCEKLKGIFPFIALVGDKGDLSNANFFEQRSTIKTINFCGKLNLHETASIIKNAKYFLGNDSGLGHIASAVQTPSFTIFGKEDPHRYRPWGNLSKWYKHSSGDITLIDPKKVFQKIINIMN